MPGLVGFEAVVRLVPPGLNTYSFILFSDPETPGRFFFVFADAVDDVDTFDAVLSRYPVRHLRL